MIEVFGATFAITFGFVVAIVFSVLSIIGTIASVIFGIQFLMNRAKFRNAVSKNFPENKTGVAK